MSLFGSGVDRKVARGALVLALLAAAGCQQSETAQGGRGGMFDGASRKDREPQNAAAPSNPQPAAPGPAPVQGPPIVATPTPAMTPPAPAANTSAANPAQQDRRIRITNRSGQIIREVRGSAASQHNYGPDRIPQGMLADGGSVVVDFNDGNGECVYDLFVLFADGSRRDQGGVNVCRSSEWMILPTGSAIR